MKREICVLMCMLMVAGCQQTPPVEDIPVSGNDMVERPQGYVALPGRAATSDTPSETITAFEFATAHAENPMPIAEGGASMSEVPQPAETVKQEGPKVAPPALPQQIRIPKNLPKTAPIPDPRPVEDSELSPTAQSAGTTYQEAANVRVRDTRPIASTGGSGYAGYAVQITNGTSGRLFFEVQDDSGNIFPFGPMYAGQRIATRPQTNRPIQGHLRIVVRDPDRPGAPELRRYNVEPPASYEGRTVGITILPGGRYRASVDGKEYYRSEPQH